MTDEHRPLAALPEDAVVVRGGLMASIDHLIEQAEDNRAEHGFLGLSVWCGLRSEGETVEDVVALVAEESPIPNNQVRLAVVGDLCRAGFELVKTGDHPRHYDVLLSSVEVEVVERFESVFGPPRENPRR